MGDAALKGGFKVDEHLNNVSGIVAAKDVKLQNLIPEFSTNLDISTLDTANIIYSLHFYR